MKRMLFFYVMVGLLLSCNSRKENASLFGNKWVLESIDGRTIKLQEATSEVYMILEDGTNSVNGKAGCNRFFGSYMRGDNARLTFSGMGATRMACPDMDIEVQFFKTLDSTKNFLIEGDKLSLKGDKDNVLAVFKKEEKQVDK